VAGLRDRLLAWGFKETAHPSIPLPPWGRAGVRAPGQDAPSPQPSPTGGGGNSSPSPLVGEGRGGGATIEDGPWNDPAESNRPSGLLGIEAELFREDAHRRPKLSRADGLSMV